MAKSHQTRIIPSQIIELQLAVLLKRGECEHVWKLSYQIPCIKSTFYRLATIQNMQTVQQHPMDVQV